MEKVPPPEHSGTAGRGVVCDPMVLDEVERRFWLDLWHAAVPDAVLEQGIGVRTCGSVQAMAVAELPDVPMFNLVLGAASPGAVEEGHLASAVEWLESLGVGHEVRVTPGLAGTGAAEDWLNRGGYHRSHGRVRFLRGAAPPTFGWPAGIQVEELSAYGEGVSDLVTEAFGLNPWVGTFFDALPERDGWRSYIALDEAGCLAATAVMLTHEGIAKLGVAATHESARGRGCHLALLHRRIVDAGADGCHTLLAETEERIGDRDGPSAGCRNLVRAGFKQACLRPAWRSPRLSDSDCSDQAASVT